MKPRVLEIDPNSIDIELVKQAADCIKNKGLVAFPTETVYGLGANALDPEAVARIFEVKERPLDDPLIVHIASKKDLYPLVKNVPFEIERLVDSFWPGPLTVVLEKSELVPDIVTCGFSTVAVRMPRNRIAACLIAFSGVPIAAPSANMFGRPSPTLARHVIDDLDGKIDIILDGGSAEIGIESTVVEAERGKIVVHRPGGISINELESTIGGIVEVKTGSEFTSKSPGMYPRHYAPHAKVILIEDGSQQIERVLETAHGEKVKGRKVGIMAKEEHAELYKGCNIKILGSGNDGKTCAFRLFHLLREFDKEKMDVIVAEGIPEVGLGMAVMNRLKKAAAW